MDLQRTLSCHKIKLCRVPEMANRESQKTVFGFRFGEQKFQKRVGEIHQGILLSEFQKGKREIEIWIAGHLFCLESIEQQSFIFEVWILKCASRSQPYVHESLGFHVKRGCFLKKTTFSDWIQREIKSVFSTFMAPVYIRALHCLDDGFPQMAYLIQSG